MRGNKILIVNGPNINCLNHRENIYPNHLAFSDLMSELNLVDQHLEWFHSNSEGRLIDEIQSVINNQEIGGLIINPGGYSHYSIAILDALLLLDIPKVEVHMTDISEREAFRQLSVTANGVDQVFKGNGIDSYKDAILYLRNIIGTGNSVELG